MAPKSRRPREEAEKFAALLRAEMPEDAEWMIGGSYRRKAPTIGDLDVMIVTESGLFGDFQFPKSFTAIRRGPQIVNGILVIDGDPVEAIGCDFWSCKPEHVGAFQMFITGPAALNIAQRAKAQLQGLTLSQYGVFERGKLIELNPERAVYDYLGLAWMEPEERQRWAEGPPKSEKQLVYTWKMSSDSGRGSYTVTRTVTDAGDIWECECLAFTYSREMPQVCKHIKRKKQELGL